MHARAQQLLLGDRPVGVEERGPGSRRENGRRSAVSRTRSISGDVRQTPRLSSSPSCSRAIGTRRVMSAHELASARSLVRLQLVQRPQGSPRAGARPRAGPRRRVRRRSSRDPPEARCRRRAGDSPPPAARGRADPGSAAAEAAPASAAAPARARPRHRFCRRGKRKAYRSSTTQTALSQPSARGLQRFQPQLRELPEETPHGPFVHSDVRAPDRHRPRLAAGQDRLVCQLPADGARIRSGCPKPP